MKSHEEGEGVSLFLTQVQKALGLGTCRGEGGGEEGQKKPKFVRRQFLNIPKSTVQRYNSKRHLNLQTSITKEKHMQKFHNSTILIFLPKNYVFVNGSQRQFLT